MKLGFICSEYPPGLHGGIGTFVQVLGRALVQAGHEVRVIGCYKKPPRAEVDVGRALLPVEAERRNKRRAGVPVLPSSPAADYEEDRGVRVWRLRIPSYRGGWVHARYSLYRTVARWCREGAIEIVEVPDYQGWVAGWPALPVPVVARLHGSSTYFAHEMHQRPNRLARWLESRSLARADAWCSVSRYTAEVTQELFRLSKPCGAVLYNPVEVPPTAASAERAPHDVVFTGTLVEKKGVVPLFKCWPAVLRQEPRARLHMYGKDGRYAEGSMREYLLSQLSPVEQASIVFHGHQPRESVFQALDRARLAIFPSYAEAFAIAPLEAMARGCPTIYSQRGSGPELLEHGSDGWLIDPDKPESISQAIVRLLHDDVLVAQFAERSRERIRRHFALDRIIPQNEAFYRECVAAFPRSRREAAQHRAATAQQETQQEGVGRFANRMNNTLTSDAAMQVAFPAQGTATAVGPDPNVLESKAWVRGQPTAPMPPTEGPLPPGVTVCVCTYKRPDSLRRFLDSLPAQDRRPQRLVIVDASPQEDTSRMVAEHRQLAEFAEEVFYFRVTGEYDTLTCSRNYALQWVATDLLVFFDDDIVLLPDCLREMDIAHRQGGDVIVGVGAHDHHDIRSPSLHWRMRRWLAIVPHLRPGGYCRSGMSIPWAFLQPTEETVAADWLSGCAMMWKTSAARAVGFNEGFGGHSTGEDLDFSLKVGRLGKLVVAGRARVLHLPDRAGRPNCFMMGYSGISNAYAIHKSCLHRRSLADGAWFMYAYAADTALRLAAMLRPGKVRDRWRFICGRLKFFRERLLGRNTRRSG